MKRRTLPSLLTAAGLLTVASAASAHGGIPRAHSIIVQPGDSERVILRSNVWGLFDTTDGGETWSWVCSEAWGGTSTSFDRLSIAVFPSGTVAIANQFDGLQVSSSGDFCDFEPAADFETATGSELVQDVVLAEADGSLAYALTSTGSQDGITVQLWESTDQAASWTPVGQPLPDDGANDFSAASVAVAPSDTSRLYVAGKYSGQPGGVVQRSDDAGQSWQAFTIPVDASNWTARLVGISPTNPDVVYLWVDLIEGSGQTSEDQLWMSTDGAATWEMILQGGGDLPGFAISPDGATVAVAGPADGLLTAAAADLESEGGSALSQTFDGQVFGLTWTEDGLYAGNDDFGVADDRFTFGISTDEGASFSGIMQVCDATLIACGADTRTGSVCGTPFEDFETDMAQRCTEGGGGGAGGAGGGGGSGGGAGGGSAAGATGMGAMGGGASSPDGGIGVGPGGASDDSGCSCAVPGRSSGGRQASLLLLGAGMAAGSFRRRRRRAS